MSLRGYKKKYKSALWLSFAKKAPQTRPDNKNASKRILRAKKSTWIRARTPERAKEERLYRPEAREFVQDLNKKGDLCPVVLAIPELRDGFKYGHRISAKIRHVHHIYGRKGNLLRWKRGWMGASIEGHRWIHSHIAEARKRGWYAPLGEWDNESIIEKYGNE